jgi:cytochrome c biogenesis protein CcmG, thiol:disulfide interchange protein DsbE
VVAALVALLAFGVSTKSPRTGIDDHLARGQGVTPPAFTLSVLQRGLLGPRLSRTFAPGLRDGRVSLAELKDQPTVLNFWASWCPPCRTEAPLLQRTWVRARTRGIAFVGLDKLDITTDARAFIREYGITYPNIRDGADKVARGWGVTGLPETFFISAGGKVVAHVIGAIDARQLRRGILAAELGRPLGAIQGGDRRSTP